MNTFLSRVALGVTLAGVIAVAQAQEPPVSPPGPGNPTANDQPGEPPHGPPPEAYQACVGKSAGSRAEFVSPHGDTVKGSCETDSTGNIVLRPDRPKGGTAGGHRGPPPEAYQACSGKAVGSRAQFMSPRGDTVSGTCEREGETLVLRPDRPPPGNGGDKPGQ